MPGTNGWGRLSQRRLSRRSILSASARAGVGAAGLALVGCGDDDDDGQAVADETPDDQTPDDQVVDDGDGDQVVAGAGGLLPGELTPEQEAADLTREEELRLRYHWSKLQNVPGQEDGPKYGGTFTFAGFDPGNWDLTAPGASIMSSFAGHHYNGLVTFPMSDFDNAHKLTPEGDLAESWETPDGTTFVFNIHAGVNFQDKAPTDGRALTMDDIKVSHEALAEAAFQGPTYTAVGSIEASEADRTVRFNMTEPAAYFLNNLMVPVHVVFPPELIGTDQFASDAVGTGPFILQELEPGVSWRATRNPDYFRTDPRSGMQMPYIDELVSLNFIGNNEGRLTAWQTGELDAVWAQDFLEFERAMSDHPDSVIQVATPPPGAQNYVSFKLEKAPWNDGRVRQALSLGLDRAELRDGVHDGVAGAGYSQDWSFDIDPATGDFREWPWRFDELGSFHPETPRVDEALQLLDAAGFNSDNPLTFQYVYQAAPGTGQNHHLAMLDQWNRNLGAQGELQTVETVSWIGVHFSRDYDDLLGSWFSGPAFDPDGYSYGPLNSSSPGNFYGVNDPDIDRLTAAQRVELDIDARRDQLNQIRILDLDNAYRIWTVNAYKFQLRKPTYYNVVDTIHAWGNIGWGAKGDEKVWINA